MSKILVSILLIVGMLLSGIVMAQQNQPSPITVQFNSTPLNLVLDTLKRSDPSLQFTMATVLGDRKITASLVDVTVDEALQIVLNQVGLTSIKDNGVYQIREKANANGRSLSTTTKLPAPVFMNRPVAPGEGTSTIQSTVALAATAEQKKNLPIRVIIIKFADPALFAILFGGGIIYGDEGSIGGSNNSGGNSGNSNSGSSSRGSSSSSRGSSSSSSSRSR
jgi:uncharacterized membrane protein YgcG